jgi:hypothetical protein
MNSPRGRSIEVDFFRGITAMLIIARGWNDWKAHQSRAAVYGAGCG